MSGSFCPATACTLARREKLVDALMLLTGEQGEITAHSARPWASITFSGTQHAITLDFEGAAAVEAGEEFVARLEDHEFNIPGQIVADAAIKAVEHVRGMPALIVHAEILMLEEE